MNSKESPSPRDNSMSRITRNIKWTNESKIVGPSAPSRSVEMSHSHCEYKALLQLRSTKLKRSKFHPTESSEPRRKQHPDTVPLVAAQARDRNRIIKYTNETPLATRVSQLLLVCHKSLVHVLGKTQVQKNKSSAETSRRDYT